MREQEEYTPGKRKRWSCVNKVESQAVWGHKMLSTREVGSGVSHMLIETKTGSRKWGLGLKERSECARI